VKNNLDGEVLIMLPGQNQKQESILTQWKDGVLLRGTDKKETSGNDAHKKAHNGASNLG
jgi:hypothetical protein